MESGSSDNSSNIFKLKLNMSFGDKEEIIEEEDEGSHESSENSERIIFDQSINPSFASIDSFEMGMND